MILGNCWWAHLTRQFQFQNRFQCCSCLPTAYSTGQTNHTSPPHTCLSSEPAPTNRSSPVRHTPRSTIYQCSSVPQPSHIPSLAFHQPQGIVLDSQGILQGFPQSISSQARSSCETFLSIILVFTIPDKQQRSGFSPRPD